MLLSEIENSINEFYEDVEVEFYHSDDLDGQWIAIGGFYDAINGVELAVSINEDEFDWDLPVKNDIKQVLSEIRITIEHENRHGYQAAYQIEGAGMEGLFRNLTNCDSMVGYLSNMDELDAFSWVDAQYALKKYGWDALYTKGNIIFDYFKTFGAKSPVFKKFIKKTYKRSQM